MLGNQSELLDAMGIYQHHDAVSGTAKQAVADDYSRRLHKAMMDNLEGVVGNDLVKDAKRKFGVVEGHKFL
jgi:hypothetical protein